MTTDARFDARSLRRTGYGIYTYTYTDASVGGQQDGNNDDDDDNDRGTKICEFIAYMMVYECQYYKCVYVYVSSMFTQVCVYVLYVSYDRSFMII